MTAAAMPVAVAGASGRMGRMLIEAIENAADLRLAGALDVAGSASVGQDASAFLGRASGTLITSDLAQGLSGAQVLIDFTRPEGTLAHLAACRERGVNLVIGTTGFSDAQKAQIAEHARHIAIVMAPNMSVGVNVLLKLLDTAARALNEGYDIEIVEAHHRHKVDAPSGTALALGEAVAAALGRDLKACAVYGREGVTGERDPSTIGFATVRGGDIIGERVEITHKATSRAGFAQGALRAARFLAGRTSGLFDMNAVLGIE
jgi:4-hydroxy-tetrahydrodipicolinate reductase